MKPGISIEEEGDVIMYPQEPFTAAQWEELLDKTALTLQKWTRGLLARKRLREMKFVFIMLIIPDLIPLFLLSDKNKNVNSKKPLCKLMSNQKRKILFVLAKCKEERILLQKKILIS